MRIALLLLLGTAEIFGEGLRAGAARVDITPEGPIWMSGYASCNHPSTGVRQHLFAQALAIDDGAGARLAIVSTDLVGIPPGMAEEVATRVHQQIGIERSRFLLNSSHTL